MSITRVAIIFNSVSRPETTGVYFRRALGELVEVEHFQPDELHRLPQHPFDLYLQIDDGYEGCLPEHLRPAAFYAIDTHMDIGRYRRSVDSYDLVYAAQCDGAESLSQSRKRVPWLPLACDPTFHRKHDTKKIRDLCFIGNMVYGERVKLLSLLQKKFPSMLVDQRYFDEMARVYSESRIVFNRSIKNDINMRVFEALACGSLLLTNCLKDNSLAELFQDGVHLATYRDADELLDKAEYYLKHEEVREHIAANGLAEVYAKHTYRHRVEQILTDAEQLQSKVTLAASVSSKQPAHFSSDPFYYGYVRPEILALVPSTATSILDIGCGSGRLGEAIKSRQQAKVTGLEFNPSAAELASERLEAVHQGDVETMELNFGDGRFDAVICADVLEHLKDPLRLLRKVRQWLQPQGRLIVSLPNVRHHSVVRGLLEGHWMYEPAGLLDETHLRFFTRREAEKLLDRAGFEIREIQMVPGAEHSDWERQGRPGEVKLGQLFIGGMSPEDAEEFHAYQYLFSATPKPRQSYGKTSIILVTHNGLNDTRECVSSLLQLTDESFELICIDNGSTDGTPDYLESIARSAVIRNSENRGFPAAVNQGLKIAKGEQVLLLNNDTVITTGWLHRLLKALHSHDQIGLVGPVTNCAPGAQRVNNVPYGADLIGMDGFAWDLATRHRGETIDVPTLSGFCLLIRREVLRQIGFLDEQFGIGTMEDDDYCLRASRAGWRIIVAQDVYIHHSGHRTFKALGMDFDALAAKNEQVFEKKWKDTSSENENAQFGMTSIILVTHGQLPLTQACIASVRRHTSEPYELIVVDNASPDETQTWLRTQQGITVISNGENKGFPAAANQGMRLATGKQILLLNNDTVVTSGWMNRLLKALHSKPEMGLVGPCSNRISGEQQINVSYDQDSLDGLEDFAAQLSLQNGGSRVPTDRLVGFCLLIKRELIDKIGYLDEQFGIGNFEDDDLCLRAMQAGYQLAIAQDAFIHHVGHATFRQSGIDFEALLQHNESLFQRKWGKPNPTSIHLDQVAVTYQLNHDASQGALLLERVKKVLSLCMIVRDNADTIVPCIESIRPWVDEMIVVDTGSQDDTPQLVQAMGAKLVRFPWCDDFSAARNESLKHATGQWIFWMDSDDVITEECGRRLREMAYSKFPETQMGFIMQVHCPGPGPQGHLNVTVVDHVKLFRNKPELRFEGRIHEQIIPSIRRCDGEIGWTDLFVVHSGYDHSSDGQKRKLERDFKLLHLELQERPEHTFTLFNLGMTTVSTGEFEKAVGYLQRSIAAAGPHDSHLRKAYALLATAHQQSGDNVEAERTCIQGLQRFPLDAELRFRKATILQELGRHHEAIAVYQDLLARKEPLHFASVDLELEGYKTLQNLALSLSEVGDEVGAEKAWSKVIDAVPEYRTGWRGLVASLLTQGKTKETVELAKLATSKGLLGEGEYLLGQAALAVGDVSLAASLYEQAIQLNPEDPEVLQALSRLHFEHGNLMDAQPMLERLVELQPKDPSALHNLGTIYLKANRFSEAERCFQRSLSLRPQSQPTLEYLEAARQGIALL